MSGGSCLRFVPPAHATSWSSGADAAVVRGGSLGSTTGMGYHGGAVSHNGSGSSTSKQQRLGDAATAASSGSAGVVNPLAKQGKPAPPAARAGAEKPFEGASTPAVGTSAPPSAEPEVHTVSSELIIAQEVVYRSYPGQNLDVSHVSIAPVAHDFIMSVPGYRVGLPGGSKTTTSISTVVNLLFETAFNKLAAIEVTMTTPIGWPGLMLCAVLPAGKVPGCDEFVTLRLHVNSVPEYMAPLVHNYRYVVGVTTEPKTAVVDAYYLLWQQLWAVAGDFPAPYDYKEKETPFWADPIALDAGCRPKDTNRPSPLPAS